MRFKNLIAGILMTKETLLGMLVGTVLTFIGMCLFTLFFSDTGIIDSIVLLYAQGKLGGLISLGALLNLPVFFYLLQQYRYKMAYGMVGILLFLVGLVALLKVV